MLFQKLRNNHLLMSAFYKGFSGLSLFISIPLLIKYLGSNDYAVWVLVFTLFQWVLLMDFGIQSSLKTKIPILLHENKIDLLKSYIKSTYKISLYIASGIFTIFIISLSYIDLKSALNISFHDASFINKLFILNVFFFCVNFVTNIYKSLFIAFLKGKFTEQSIALNQFIFLLLVFLSLFYFPDINVENKLFLVSILNGVFGLLVNIGYTIYFFRIEKLNLKSKEKTPKEFIVEILKLGSKFMLTQMALLFMFNIDNYIISNHFSPKEVVPYDTVNKLFQLPIMILFAGLSPLWSMFAKDYIDKNHTNLLKMFKKFNLFFILIVVLILLFAAICPYLISIWIKEKLDMPTHLILYVAIVACFRVFITFYTFFLNGIGKLNNYLFILLFSVVLKLPLTNFFINLQLGINSVVLATLVLMLFWILFIPWECYRIVFKLKKLN